MEGSRYVSSYFVLSGDETEVSKLVEPKERARFAAKIVCFLEKLGTAPEDMAQAVQNPKFHQVSDWLLVLADKEAAKLNVAPSAPAAPPAGDRGASLAWTTPVPRKLNQGTPVPSSAGSGARPTGGLGKTTPRAPVVLSGEEGGSDGGLPRHALDLLPAKAFSGRGGAPEEFTTAMVVWAVSCGTAFEPLTGQSGNTKATCTPLASSLGLSGTGIADEIRRARNRVLRFVCQTIRDSQGEVTAYFRSKGVHSVQVGGGESEGPTVATDCSPFTDRASIVNSLFATQDGISPATLEDVILGEEQVVFRALRERIVDWADKNAPVAGAGAPSSSSSSSSSASSESSSAAAVGPETSHSGPAAEIRSRTTSLTTPRDAPGWRVMCRQLMGLMSLTHTPTPVTTLAKQFRSNAIAWDGFVAFGVKTKGIAAVPSKDAGSAGPGAAQGGGGAVASSSAASAGSAAAGASSSELLPRAGSKRTRE
jgi:hypothetical protein